MSDMVEGPKPGYLIIQMARLFRKAGETHLKALGIGTGQVPVIIALQGGGELAQKDLAVMAGVEQPTMAQLLSRMERDGMIVRSPSPDDARSALIRLSPAALEMLPEFTRRLNLMNELAVEGFSEFERLAFSAVAMRLIANLESKDTANAPSLSKP
jgi:MarR family transcriptional regulator for hemolysin